jgi:putative salt-induced outer membrane protein YdiY
MTRNLARTLLLTAIIASSATAQAPAPPPSREGTTEASFVGTTGNSSTQSVGLGAELIVRPRGWETRFKSAYVRSEVGGVIKAQTVTAAARAQRKFANRASLFSQYGYLSDRFAGTLARHTADFGVAGALIQRAAHTVTADAGFGYATDTRVAGPGISTATAGAGATYKWKVSATADLTDDGRYVGSVPKGADWRYTNVLALAAKINSALSLKVSNTVRYVNVPVTGFENTDVITAIAIVAKF